MAPPQVEVHRDPWVGFCDASEVSLGAASHEMSVVQDNVDLMLDKVSSALHGLLTHPPDAAAAPREPGSSTAATPPSDMPILLTPSANPVSPTSTDSSPRGGTEVDANVVPKLVQITGFLRSIGRREGFVEELLAGKFLRARDQLHAVRRLHRHCPEITRVVRMLLMCLGVFTRSLKKVFDAQNLSFVAMPAATPDSSKAIAVQKQRFGINRSGTWPRLAAAQQAWGSPHASPMASPSPVHSQGLPLPSPVGTPKSAQPLPHPRLGKIVPPPVETRHFVSASSPSSSHTPHSHCHSPSPSTPLSCLSAHMYNTFMRKRDPVSRRHSPCHGIICRICEVRIPPERTEQHTEICVSRMTAVMVLEHVISRLKTGAAKAVSAGQPRQAALLSELVDSCEAMREESQVNAMGQVLLRVTHCRAEAEQFGDDKLNSLVDAAANACATTLQRHQVAKDAMPPSEMIDIVRLRGTTSVSLADFHVKGVIARGAFGRVFLVEKRNTRDVYALKVVSQTDVTQRKMAQKLLNERDIMAFTDSKLVVELHYSFASTRYLYFAMEHHAGGDLFSLLERSQVLTEPVARFYIAEVYLALEHLHSMSIVHRDIKPDNILLSDSGHIKLTDFGLSDIGAGFVVDSVIAQADKACNDTPRNGLKDGERGGGTPEYVAPEIILAEESDRTADLWSLGVLLYEFLQGATPFYAETNEGIFDNILRGAYEAPSEASPHASDLIHGLLKYPPEERLDNLRGHPFFEPVGWDTILQSEAPCRPDLTRDNFKERSLVYPVNASDMDFLKEELCAERRVPGDEMSPRLGREFLRRRSGGDVLSLRSFQLAAPHLARLAPREARQRLANVPNPSPRSGSLRD